MVDTRRCRGVLVRGSELRRQPKAPLRVGPSHSGDLLHSLTSGLGYRCRRVHDVGRLVAASPLGLRRAVRAVGLEDEGGYVKRSRHFAQLTRRGTRDTGVNRDHEAHFHVAAGQLQVAAEVVHDPQRPALSEEGARILRPALEDRVHLLLGIAAVHGDGKQALGGQDLTVYGDGSQTRSFCYVTDEIEGILRLARSQEHQPVNIGNPNEFTMVECAQRVLAVTGSKSKLAFEPLPQDDPKQRRPDISRARALLGWEPKTDLETGLGWSLDYFRQAVAAGS
jgi:hypothetical protein